MSGRKSTFTQEVVDEICKRLMDGESLRTICLADDMPTRATVFNWLNANATFFDQYARAREVQAEVMADEILNIADDGSNDYVMVQRGDEQVEVANHEHINRSRLRVDSRKWLLSKLLPKKYGDKVTQQLTGADGGSNLGEFTVKFVDVTNK